MKQPTIAPFDHRSGATLEVDGARLYHERTGTRGAPVLLLLHGGFGTIDDFNGWLAACRVELDVVGLDSRGQGRSTLGPHPLTYARLQADVERLLDHLGIERCGLVGISDGGIVGYRLAAMAASRIDRLVTVSARWHRDQAERTRATFEATTGASQRAEQPETWDAYRALNAAPDFDRLAQALAAMWLDREATGHPGDAVSAIRCPLLVVHGDDDALLTRQAVVDVAGRVAGARLLNVPFAGHPVQKDQPLLFSTAMGRFLADSG